MDDNPYGFASPDDKPIPYMERIRNYDTTLGYGKPYEWAHYSEASFTECTPARKTATLGSHCPCCANWRIRA